VNGEPDAMRDGETSARDDASARPTREGGGALAADRAHGDGGARADAPAPSLPEQGVVPLVKPGARRHGIRIAIAMAAALIAIVGGTRYWTYLQTYESTDDAQIDGHIHPISSRIEGTIIRVYVENTQAVRAGQPLAEIDPHDYQVAAEKARADLAQAQAQVELARRDADAAAAKLKQSQATDAKTANDAERYRVLVDARVASREEYEERVRLASVAAATVEADAASAAAAAKAITSRLAAVKSAGAALDQALLNLSYTKIAAPVAGVVGKKTVEVGQRVEPGEELLAVVPLDDIWVTANFKETQLRRIRPGQPVTVTVDALGESFQGYVEGIAGASGERYSLMPPENATGNYVKVVQRFPVKIRFRPGQDQAHRLRPGMSVEPTVWLK
jgi:membrane fusion protein, multidrug efflux system